MGSWIIRKGSERGAGEYLFDARPWTYWGSGNAGAAGWNLLNQPAQPQLGTAHGGTWFTPWWGAEQAGAKVYNDRRQAFRDAKAYGGRVVLLRQNACAAESESAAQEGAKDNASRRARRAGGGRANQGRP